MDVIYGLLPGMLLLGLIGVGVFFWAVRSGQYDDMEGSANRILLDEEPVPKSKTESDPPENTQKSEDNHE